MEDLELIEKILNDFENNYFLGKKQLKKLREINANISIKSISKLIDEWSLYLSETLYADKFTKDFLMLIIKKYIKIP